MWLTSILTACRMAVGGEISHCLGGMGKRQAALGPAPHPHPPPHRSGPKPRARLWSINLVATLHLPAGIRLLCSLLSGFHESCASSAQSQPDGMVAATMSPGDRHNVRIEPPWSMAGGHQRVLTSLNFQVGSSLKSL